MPKLRTVAGTKIYRTDVSRFSALPDYAFHPNYVDVHDEHLGELRMHYVDESPHAPSATVLLQHGEPSWSYLYRHMVGPLVEQGYRVIAPALIGFGKSDKPGAISDYSYARHVNWMLSFIDALHLERINLFCQDWGGLIGLRVAAVNPHRFARLVIANTGLPEGDRTMPKAFRQWQRFARWSPYFPNGKIVEKGSVREFSDAERAAYDAPFPTRAYKAGTRAFPLLVPTTPDDPGAIANRQAWQSLEAFAKPVLTLFSDRDPVTRGGHEVIQRRIPGAANQPHRIVQNAGHFLQEDAPSELAESIAAFIAST